jgi:predicted phage terminase large subunit-like protein
MRAFSDVDRKNVIDSYDQKLSTRLNHQDRSAIILIMQRLHVGDLTGHLLKKSETKWIHLVIPMEYDGKRFDAGKDIGRPELNDPRTKDGELLHPDLFSAAAVRRLKEDLGTYGSAGQLAQRPNPEGGGILKAPWWRIWPEKKGLPEFEHIFLSWDTAYTEQDLKNVAYSGYLGFGVFWDEQEQRYALMLMRSWYERVEYPELRRKAREITVEVRPDSHLIEKKASGISLVQDMRRIKGVRIRTYQPDRDKIARAYAVSAMLESGQIWAPDRKWADKVINHIAEFPNGSPPSADLTDMLTQAMLYLRNGYWVSHPDDDDPPPPEPPGEDEDNVIQIKRGAYG